MYLRLYIYGIGNARMEIELKEQCLYTIQFANDQTVNDIEDMEYMVKKLMKKCERWTNRKYPKNEASMH
jgi:hypothetical protein